MLSEGWGLWALLLRGGRALGSPPHAPRPPPRAGQAGCAAGVAPVEGREHTFGVAHTLGSGPDPPFTTLEALRFPLLMSNRGGG